ncbi:Hydroxymethylglutaryl-CoA lyase YngG [Dyadobacter sp. CECT 9275]|uniref:Hydroxymethylglutaryl-CoA lyase YngG n=1 Tax=Dyadobacter helix TaxID=2822344 RepID=A0A916JHC6_9BACT|nr:hydroxymethylglutaryl-CoA lyase [Dyadobacter sp. CECT 9275]CAG5007411.1 Hydroxymethylglutaryl-CoA lyase YngG [Dyadobacter sp. CECT 9275]
MKIVECPRDAWQGHHTFIPTPEKAAYINQLLRVGFDTIDFGSFVSASAMPQVRDTAHLIDRLDLSGTSTRLLSIVANERGAQEACAFEQIRYLGFPFSVSETFQMRNTHSTISESLGRVERITAAAHQHGKEVVIYISMGFGNPYDDEWNTDIVLNWVDKLSLLGIRIFSLSDTVGVARETDISSLFAQLISTRPDLEFGAHFHSLPGQWKTKLDAAFLSGCRRFDGAILGYGGCPMAQDDLVGNMPTEKLIAFAKEKKEPIRIDIEALEMAKGMFIRLINS